MLTAIALTLIVVAGASGALFNINRRHFMATGRKRSRDAMIVTGIFSGWCFLAAVWLLTQK